MRATLRGFVGAAAVAAVGTIGGSPRETCQVYIAARPPEGYKAGDRSMGGTIRAAPERGYGALRAIDAATGDRKWEVRHPTSSWAGVLSTAGGVVFSGTNEGEVFAAETRTGKDLWRYMLGAPLYTAPVTYMIVDRQYVTVAAGTTITSFALAQR